MDKLPIVSVSLYGFHQRAVQLVGNAKKLAYKLAGQNQVSVLVERFDDGSFIEAKRIKEVFTALVYGAKAQSIVSHIPAQQRLPAEDYWLWSGLVTQPLLTQETLPNGQTTTYITEFTATQTTMQHANGLLNKQAREKAPRLVTPPVEDFHVASTDNTYSQAGFLTPSMYSGTMKAVVQCVLGLGELGEGGRRGGRPDGYPIEYGCTFYATHGCTQASDGSWWLVEISPLGVIAGPLPVMDVKHTDDPFFAQVGGVPTGGLPSSAIILATALDIAPFYDGTEPVLDVWHGWVFDTKGTTAMNVCATKHDTHWLSSVFSIDITITPQNIATCKAVVRKRAEGRLNSPSRWWEETDAQTLYLPSMGWQYQTSDVLPLGTLAWDNIANQTWLPSGTHPSFLNTAAPIQVFTRTEGTSGVALPVVFPPAPLDKGRTIVDAPLFVTCIQDRFHVLRHYWRMQPVGGFFKHPQGWNVCDPSNDADTPGCWYIHSGLVGTPPTIYSNVFDSRLDTFMAVDVIDPNAARYGQMCTQCNKPPLLPSAYVVTQFKRNQWLCHTELYLPFMCREDYQLLDLRCVGSGAVTHTDGEVYGVERVYTFAPPYKFGSTNADARLVGKNTRRKVETFGIYPFTIEDGTTYTMSLGCHSDWRYPTSVRADRLVTTQGLSTRLKNRVPLKTKPDLYIQAHEEVIPVPGAELPAYRYSHALTGEAFSCWSLPGYTNQVWFSTLFFEAKTSPLCTDTTDILDDIQNLARTADVNMYGSGTEMVHTQNNGYNVHHWVFDNYPWQSDPPAYPSLPYNDAPQPYAAWKDETSLITYSNGLPSVYMLPKVTRLNANQLRRSTANGPTSSSSAVGARFAMFSSPLTDGVVSFGALPASITLHNNDIVCPIGVIENG